VSELKITGQPIFHPDAIRLMDENARLKAEAAHWEERVRPLIEALEHITNPNPLERPCCKKAWETEQGFENHDVEVADDALAAFRSSGKDSPDDGGGK
jgi:hypothetical protein